MLRYLPWQLVPSRLSHVTLTTGPMICRSRVNDTQFVYDDDIIHNKDDICDTLQLVWRHNAKQTLAVSPRVVQDNITCVYLLFVQVNVTPCRLIRADIENIHETLLVVDEFLVHHPYIHYLCYNVNSGWLSTRLDMLCQNVVFVIKQNLWV